MMTSASKLADRFLRDGAKIAYRELSERGGMVVAWFDDDRWYFRHETETDAQASSDPMSIYRARAIFPTDAVEWAA